MEGLQDAETLRLQLSPRGPGNLRHPEMGPGGVEVRIDNSANVLTTVGMVQGIYEKAFDTEFRA